MRHTEKVPAFVERDALDIECGPQIAAIRIPGLSGVKHDIRFGHRRSGITVIGNGERTRSKAVTKKSTAKGHGVDVISRDDRRGRIHHSPQLNAPHHLVPHVESGRDGRIP